MQDDRKWRRSGGMVVLRVGAAEKKENLEKEAVPSCCYGVLRTGGNYGDGCSRDPYGAS